MPAFLHYHSIEVTSASNSNERIESIESRSLKDKKSEQATVTSISSELILLVQYACFE
jgi:hypothetical protein